MTGLLGTGTIGKLGYAIAWGSQGTTGNFPGGFIPQTALLQTSVVNPGIGAPYRPAANASPPPPDLTHANANNLVNYYPVSGGYVQRNFVGKLIYGFSPKTTLQFTAYSANDWSNSTGEGDNDYQTYPYVLYGAEQTLAAIRASKGGRNTILVNGSRARVTTASPCSSTTRAGYTCMNAAEYAVNFYGPFGGSIDRWRTLGDTTTTHAQPSSSAPARSRSRASSTPTTTTSRRDPAPQSALRPRPELPQPLQQPRLPAERRFPDVEKRFRVRLHVAASVQHERAVSLFVANGMTYNTFGTNPPLYLATASYFMRDTWTPNERFSGVRQFLGPALTRYRPRPTSIRGFRSSIGRTRAT